MRRNRTRTAVAGVLATVAAVLLLAGRAPADATDDALAEARTGLVSRLESLLAWAHDQRIAGFRHGLARRILELAPDHAKARATLQYKRAGKNAPWVQDRAYVVPGDVNRAALPDAEKRLAAVDAWYREALVAAAAGAEPARREALLDGFLDTNPQDPALRRVLGHVEEDGRWAHPEAHAARRRRAELVALGAKAREAAGQRVGRDKEGMEMGWYALRTPKRAIWSSEKWPVEIREALVFMEAGDVLAARLFGAEQEIGKESVPRTYVPLLYVCGSKEQGCALMGSIPDVADRVAELDLVAGLSLGKHGYLSIEKHREKAMGVGVRLVVDSHVDDALADSVERGWISEGIGQRVVWYATGRHGPNFVNLEGTDVARADDEIDDEPLPEQPDAWLAAAERALERHGPRRLAATLTARLNAMRSTDVLLGYALAAYLVESRPDDLASFARASAKASDGAVLVKEALGQDVGAFAVRLRRWLRDTR
jgi:hypothetical protein